MYNHRSVMFLSHMKPVYTTSTITRNSNVTKFVQFKMATNKKQASKFEKQVKNEV